MNIKSASVRMLFVLFCSINSTPLFSMHVVTGVAMSFIKNRVETDIWLYKYVPFALMVGTIAWTKIKDNQLRKKLDELNEKADNLGKGIDTLDRKADNLDKKIDQTKKEIKEEVAVVGNDVKALNAKADTTGAQLGGIGTQLNDLQEQAQNTAQQVVHVGQGVTRLKKSSVQTNAALGRINKNAVRMYCEFTKKIQQGIHNLTQEFEVIRNGGASVDDQLKNLTALTQRIFTMMYVKEWANSGIGYTAFFGGRSLAQLTYPDQKSEKKD